MIGSTIIEGIFITSSTLRNNVIVCAKVKIEILGAKLSSSLSKKTNFLIAGNKPTLSKLQKAKDLGVRVFSEKEWNDFINE